MPETVVWIGGHMLDCENRASGGMIACDCTDAPSGTVPLLTFRQSRQESLTVIRTADLARLLGQ